jgi:hypothetical protein
MARNDPNDPHSEDDQNDNRDRSNKNVRDSAIGVLHPDAQSFNRIAGGIAHDGGSLALWICVGSSGGEQFIVGVSEDRRGGFEGLLFGLIELEFDD